MNHQRGEKERRFNKKKRGGAEKVDVGQKRRRLVKKAVERLR